MPTLVERFSDRTQRRRDRHVTNRSRYRSWISARQAAGLAAEDQHDILSSAERRIPELARRLGREEVRLAERRQLALERVPVGPDPQVDVLPVIEAGAFDLLLVERKAERLDEMQRRAGRQAGAAGVAGVPVNLGMNEDDVDASY